MNTNSASPSKVVALLIGTRKGGFILRSDGQRHAWTILGPIHLGEIVHHMMLDPRDGRTMLMAARAGHLGPTVFRSTDGGETWKEAEQPPPSPRRPRGKRVASSITCSPWRPATAASPASGTPEHRRRDSSAVRTVASPGPAWMVSTATQAPRLGGREEDSPPDGATMHSMVIDPRDAGICTSACRAAESSRARMAVRTGSR